jgi:hypothetical protein
VIYQDEFGKLASNLIHVLLQ